jgi:hypothetical protein
MAQFMENHPRRRRKRGKCGLILFSRNENPQAVEMLTQPTLDPGHDGYKPKKSLLRPLFATQSNPKSPL